MPVETRGASNRAATQGLYYVENQTILNIPEGTPPTAVVTPEKGASLRIWLKNSDGPVKIIVYSTNALGLWSLAYSNDFAVGERDVLVSSNCNGKAYKVQIFATDLYATYSMLIYQN